MCNRYNIKGNPRQVADYFGAELVEEFTWKGDIFPYYTSPAIVLNEDGGRELLPMQFGITPPWSKTKRVKYSTMNARVEDIEEKKTFAKPFKKYRCLVPMSAMHESCWWGESEGNKVYFKPVDESYMAVASIYSAWSPAKGSDPLLTMSLLMRPAGDYIMEHGHHRQPFFIHEDGFDDWMAPGERAPEELKQILADHAFEPTLQFEIESELKSFSKNVKSRLKKRDEQLHAIEESGLPLGV
jgi:putative SOS response-associated peptidase YedK